MYIHVYTPNQVTVEPPVKDTLNKGHLCIKDTLQYTNLHVYIVFSSERGQPLYNAGRQNDPSQYVHYLEVPLYFIAFLRAGEAYQFNMYGVPLQFTAIQLCDALLGLFPCRQGHIPKPGLGMCLGYDFGGEHLTMLYMHVNTAELSQYTYNSHPIRLQEEINSTERTQGIEVTDLAHV